MTLRRRPTARVAVALAAVTALSACSVVGQGDEPTANPEASRTSAAAHTPPPGAEPLARFYSQSLQWKGCGIGQCASLTVPLSYADPGGQTIRIAVLRMAATRKGSRIGSLVVNPGGPGGSGVDYARAADFIVGKAVRQRFDIVGFDPRGVQRSEPVDCLDDSGMDAFLGQDPTPDDAAEESAFVTNAKQFAQGCLEKTGALLGHVSTQDAARDMDILRAALGEQKLDYLGKSYGTLLGSTYAGLFPEQVGRFVLDGVLPPDLTAAEVGQGQAEGFERATRAWAASCVEQGGCPLGDSVDAVMAGMRSLLTSLDSQPVPMSDARLSSLSEGWAANGIAEAMYEQSFWPKLTKALGDVVQRHDGTALMALADQYAERTSTGRYTGNLLEALYAVNCLDNPDTSDVATYEQRARDWSASAPTWGPFLAWSSLPCGYWPVKEKGAGPHTITAAGSGPIVVVGTTRDPATPYEWSVRLAKELANSSLVTWDGDGHTAYMRGSSCVDNAIDAYYVKGTVPKDGLHC